MRALLGQLRTLGEKCVNYFFGSSELRPVVAIVSAGAHSQTEFNKSEFAAHRAKVVEKMGPSIAIVFANREHPYHARYRQASDFHFISPALSNLAQFFF